MIIDSHAHYDDEAFYKDRDEILSGLKNYGVEIVINVGSSIETTKTTIELSEKYDFIYAAAGVHPSETMNLNENNLLWLSKQCNHKKVIAVGEIGLDYYWKEPERELQKYWFKRQLNLAREKKLPVVIHSRDAVEDTISIMKEEKADEIGGVIHCYSYSSQIAEEFLNMGFYFGIGGVLTFKNSKKLKEAAEVIPIQKILLETDCPYLAPEPYRGKRNYSAYLSFVAEKLAEIKKISYEEVIQITNQNTRQLFQLDN